MASATATLDHDAIRDWVESRGGFPARVSSTGGANDPGILRIDYPGFSGKDTLERIAWDEWFDAFDANSLAFLYQPGGRSRFSKLVDRSTVQTTSRKVAARRATSSRKRSSSRKASSTKKSSAKRSGTKKSSAKRSSTSRGGAKKWSSRGASKKATSKVVALERQLARDVKQVVRQVERVAARTRRRITKKLSGGSKRAGARR